MSRPIGEISAVFDPAVGLQASDVSEAEEEVTYLLHDATFEDAEKEADPPEGFVS
jgi:hypothetical protein